MPAPGAGAAPCAPCSWLLVRGDPASPPPAPIQRHTPAPSGSDGFPSPNFALRAISNELPGVLKKKNLHLAAQQLSGRLCLQGCSGSIVSWSPRGATAPCSSPALPGAWDEAMRPFSLPPELQSVFLGPQKTRYPGACTVTTFTSVQQQRPRRGATKFASVPPAPPSPCPHPKPPSSSICPSRLSLLLGEESGAWLSAPLVL